MQIRYRNIVRNANNAITSGSAALVENSYLPIKSGNRLKNHTKQKVIERLGKVIWINPDNSHQAIFNSAERGLVYYDLDTDVFEPVLPTDTRSEGTSFQSEPARMHTSFGNTFLFFMEMEKTPYMKVLRSAFPDRQLYEKVLAHLAHDCLKNGSFIKCGEFLNSSILTYILEDIPRSTLDCDSSYFSALSNDNVKKGFFTALIKEMRKSTPEFGRACYTDSTPLPGEAENNPFNALSSHGTDGGTIQSRLVLVLDIQTDIPVWFEIIPANVLDKSTLLSITRDVKVTLDIDIEKYDLDAGYARQELFELFNITNNTITDENGIVHDRTLLVRMPATNGYPKDKLYIQCKPDFYIGSYSFDYEHHTFFGKRVEIELFGSPEYAFVYIDKTQAESLLRGWREQHLEEWDSLSQLQQDWYQVKDGFFILIGNKDQSPKEALIEYRGRVSIEMFFRDGKTYLRILPLAKWNKQTVTGKIFHDIMEMIFYRSYRKNVASINMSMSSLIVNLDSWEAFMEKDGLLEIKTPKLQVRNILEQLGYPVLGHMDLSAFRSQILEGIPMSLEPVTLRTQRGAIGTTSLSPEERLEQKRIAAAERVRSEAQRKLEKMEAKADNTYNKAKEVAENVLKKKIAQARKKVTKVEEHAKRESTKIKAKIVCEKEIQQAELQYQNALSCAETERDQAKRDARAIFEASVGSVNLE